jgi:hypothetical protein
MLLSYNINNKGLLLLSRNIIVIANEYIPNLVVTPIILVHSQACVLLSGF